MALNPRLFAGQLSPGDWRARVSKPGFDASDPLLARDKLDFDTAWPFAGNIHAVISYRPPNPPSGSGFETVPNPKTLFFPELPYVPCVKCFLLNRNANGYLYWIEPTLRTVTYQAYKDRLDLYTIGTNNIGVIMVAVVFKIPARDIDALGTDPHPLARLMMGKRGADYGLYASRPGFDVRTCSKAQMSFSSDDTFTVINNTFSPASSQKGVADTPTDNVFTEINFTYTWKGYFPIVFFFATFNTTLNDQIYTLPTDKVVNTWGGSYPMDGSIALTSSGTGKISIRRWGKEAWGNVSIIVIDYPLPTF